MLAEEMWEREPYNFVLESLQSSWRSGGHAISLLGRFLEKIFKTKPLDGIHLVEYQDGDFQEFNCCGQPLSYWFYSGDLPKAENLPSDIFALYPVVSEVPTLSFHYDEQNRRIILEWWAGGRSAYGNGWIIRDDRKKPYLEMMGYGGWIA